MDGVEGVSEGHIVQLELIWQQDIVAQGSALAHEVIDDSVDRQHVVAAATHLRQLHDGGPNLRKAGCGGQERACSASYVATPMLGQLCCTLAKHPECDAGPLQ